MSPDQVHVEISDLVVGKVIAITGTSSERKHIKMKILQLGRLAFCFSVNISETNLVFIKKDVRLDNGSVVGLWLSTSSYEVRKVDQWLVIVVCILGL